MLRSARYALSLWLLMTALTALVFAQAPVGTLTGTVSDPSGAVIKDAEVSVRNKATGFERKVKSNDDGAFSIAALPVGVYEVQSKANGFRTLMREVTINAGSIATAEMSGLGGVGARRRPPHPVPLPQGERGPSFGLPK